MCTLMSDCETRVVPAVTARKEVAPDNEFEAGLTKYLLDTYGREMLVHMLREFAMGEDPFRLVMRRALWRGIAKRFGQGVTIATGVDFKHAETFEIGHGVYIGAHSFIQGRFDGTCIIKDRVWIGPHSYLDARNLVLEEFVGWGPGAKVLGSAHTGVPVDVPIVQTDLEIKPVRVRKWADIGTNAVLLPGVTVGEGAIVGAGSVVTRDVAPYTIVAGAPARVIRSRREQE
jgi:acetyltransferase-like isoleucine patch superfamily enzyme